MKALIRVFLPGPERCCLLERLSRHLINEETGYYKVGERGFQQGQDCVAVLDSYVQEEAKRR